jgi:DNA-binding IclR family transcriptional regulator
MSMLDGAEIVLVVRVPVNRMRTYLLGLGARMPAYATAQGRMLLAHLSDSALDRLFGDALLMPLTVRTLTDKAQLVRVGEQGWVLVDQEVVRIGESSGRDRRIMLYVMIFRVRGVTMTRPSRIGRRVVWRR